MSHKEDIEQKAEAAKEAIIETLKGAGFIVSTASFLVSYVKPGETSLQYFEDLYYNEHFSEETAIKLEIKILERRLKMLQEKGN